MKNSNCRRVRVTVLPGPAGKIIFLFGLLAMLMPALPAGAGEKKTPPMVEKHIFSPENDTPAVKSLGPRSEAAAKLEKELIFTGIISTPNGKWAIIRPARQRQREDGPWRFKVGEEVNGHRIKEIGPNYVILVKNDKPIRLALYQGSKKRPAPPPEAPPAVKPFTPATAGGRGRPVPPAAVSRSRQGGKAISSRPKKSPAGDRPLVVGQPGMTRRSGAAVSQPSSRPTINPLLEAFKHAKPAGGSSSSPPVNPFSRMIKQRNSQ